MIFEATLTPFVLFISFQLNSECAFAVWLLHGNLGTNEVLLVLQKNSLAGFLEAISCILLKMSGLMQGLSLTAGIFLN